MKSENKDKNTVKRKLLVILNLDLLNKEKNPFYKEFSYDIINIRETIWKIYILQDTSMKNYLYSKLEFLNKSLNNQKKAVQTVNCFVLRNKVNYLCVYMKY